jgi:hypothetical protein
LRETLARTNYSTNHTIGIADPKRQIRTSSGIHELGGYLSNSSLLQTINVFDDNSTLICNSIDQGLDYQAN